MTIDVSPCPAPSDALARDWARLAALLIGASGGFSTRIEGERWHTTFFGSGTGRLKPQVGRVVGDAAARHVLVRHDALIIDDTLHFWCRSATPVALAEIRAVAAVPVFATGDLGPNVVIGALEPVARHWSGPDIDNLWALAAAIRKATDRDAISLE
ncbi:MAG TPA: hypothetical protein VHC49_00790 [Mycobacteriales bacterium]|nr:hypothetical protein [Mycobacteriales bacterium]